VNNASTALEASKAAGGNCYSFFERNMDADAHATSEWLEDLKLAVARNELELYYQPKVHAQSGMIAGVEALLRWRHPTRGLVSPAVFIPLAERFGLINELGHWVITEACRQMGAWRDAGIRMRVAINVSVIQLRQPGLAASITSALELHTVDPGLLTCEITESGAMADTIATLAVFKKLQAAGIQISIDDFGTGYSSLSYLRKMPVRQLKIDRSFVMDLGQNADARSVVAAIIELAHALRLEVVAEGVETELQKNVLLELHCDKFQGFLFARPMTAAEFTGMATEGTTRKRFRESIFA
jgi:diguanylate cyclase